MRLQIRLKEDFHDFSELRAFLPKTPRERIASTYCFRAHTYDCNVVYLKQAVSFLAGTHFLNVDPKISSSSSPHQDAEAVAQPVFPVNLVSLRPPPGSGPSRASWRRLASDEVPPMDAAMRSIVNAPVFTTSLGAHSSIRRKASDQVEMGLIGQRSFLRRKATWSESTAQILGTKFGSDGQALDDEIEALDSTGAGVLMSAGSWARKGFKALTRSSSPEDGPSEEDAPSEECDDAPFPAPTRAHISQVAAKKRAETQAHEKGYAADSVGVPDGDDELEQLELEKKPSEAPVVNARIEIDVLIHLKTTKVCFFVTWLL